MSAENKKYIHQLKSWPKFHWDEERISAKLIDIRHRQGRLIGKMEGLGFQLREHATLQNLTEEILKSNEIEGEKLDRNQVRSSLARKLGMDIGALAQTDRNVEGVVAMMLDATQNYEKALSTERICSWHAALFPTGRSGMVKIRVGKWRDDKNGPMQVVSGSMGRTKIHFEAPEASRLKIEMKGFIDWFNAKTKMDPVLKAAIAHIWFVTIHPLEDGNGRITRAITDLALARSEQSSQRFYSMSAQINAEREVYYNKLEATQRGDLDITLWLEWFLDCLGRAFEGAEGIFSGVLKKTRFWESHQGEEFNDRQKIVLNRVLDGFEGNLTSSKWAKLAKCSQDTASRDIDDLLARKVLIRNPGGGRSTSYSLVEAVPKIKKSKRK